MTTVTPIIPIEELKKLHYNLTKLEQLIMMIHGPLTDPDTKKEIEEIYRVQETIEYIVIEEKKRIKNPLSKPPNQNE